MLNHRIFATLTNSTVCSFWSDLEHSCVEIINYFICIVSHVDRNFNTDLTLMGKIKCTYISMQRKMINFVY